MVALPSLINDPARALMAELAAGTPPGNFAEVGVYRGGSAQSLLAVANAQGRALYLFDTFAGIPFKDAGDHHNVGDFGDVELDALRAALPGAVFCVGLFPETLGDTGPLAFVHADADQYRSTRDICLHLGPRMVPGGLMLFDDYPHLESCRRAVDECFPRRELLADGRALVRF